MKWIQALLKFRGNSFNLITIQWIFRRLHILRQIYEKDFYLEKNYHLPISIYPYKTGWWAWARYALFQKIPEIVIVSNSQEWNLLLLEGLTRQSFESMLYFLITKLWAYFCIFCNFPNNSTKVQAGGPSLLWQA